MYAGCVNAYNEFWNQDKGIEKQNILFYMSESRTMLYLRIFTIIILFLEKKQVMLRVS